MTLLNQKIEIILGFIPTAIFSKMQNFMNMLSKANLAFNQHQYDGVEFCLKNENTSHYGIYGGVIADEMGLGKTLTTIGTMVANPVPNTLIVLPPVLLVQWQKEILRATGKQALLYHGPQKKQIKIRELNAADIVLTTYHAIRPAINNLLYDVYWDRVIFDEAHHLRNKNQAHKGAIILLEKTRIRWLITGTPIQNNEHDYHHLCAVLGLAKAIYTDKSLALDVIKTLVLKRSKKLVPSTNLPDVITHTIQVEWNDEEYDLAREIHSTLPLSHVYDQKGKYAKRLNNLNTLQRILRAQQCCIMPSLLDDDLKKYKLKYNYTSNKSSKINAVIQAINENKDNGAGKLVFCHYRKEIDIISEQLAELGIRSSTFDGRTSGPARQAILADPNNSVIILQIQTGCEGLNLQKNYSEIYFVSPHWNPSVEAQAIARCHRIGQEKQVYVYRFEMVGFDKPQQQQQQQQRIRRCILEGEAHDEIDLEEVPSISIDQYIRIVQEKKNGITEKVLYPKKEEDIIN